MESYDYLGAGTVVRRGHPLSGVDLSFILKSPEAVGDAGDQYIGLDRFGRVADQRWRTSSADVERTLYGYDRNGNRTGRTNTVNGAYSEAYTYDGLNQLATFNRNSGARTQSWDYDAVGNWESLATNGGSPQTRTHNRQNEITAVSGATSPTFDANGNMTTDETGKQYTYDAWNRLKVVKNSGGTTLKTYVYDAMNRRVAETAGGTTTDFYYSAAWQVLEEAVSGTTTQRYVWSPVYVDAMILRDRDTDANGTLDERLWVMQDANWNVVGLMNGSGVVVERYAYDAFGAVTVMNGSWAVGSTAYGWQYYHQGGRLDSTSGLYHFRNRDYSPTLGRWVTMDPIRYAAGDGNIYRGLNNSPIVYLDPTGTDAWSDFWWHVMVGAGTPVGQGGAGVTTPLPKYPSAPAPTPPTAPTPASPSQEKEISFIDGVIKKLERLPKGEQLIKDFRSKGGIISESTTTFSGGEFGNGGKNGKPFININPKKTGPKNPPESVLLYELIRAKYIDEDKELDQKARDRKLTRDEYATDAEYLTYKYAREHHDIAEEAIRKYKFDPPFDRFADDMKPGGAWETKEKYLDYAKNVSKHYQNMQKIYDALQK